jgi:8-oxo-(d)GTP phosphatase
MARAEAATLAQVGVVTAVPIRAAGGVVWRNAGTFAGEPTVEVAVIHRPRYDDWSFPKGKLASGESDLQGAVREVLEETGYHVRVGRPLGESRYEKNGMAGARTKVVRWWAMQAEEGAFSPTSEVDRLEWLSLADAGERLTRESDRDLLERFARGTAPTRTVLLVRHGSAGSSAEWAGDDRERPLDDCGVAQADELVHLLAQFEIGSILSADVRRCVETVAPVADALAVPVQETPLFSEVGYPGREAEAMALLRRQGDAQHDAIVCSQGAVIPDLLERMAGDDDFPIATSIPNRKGSTWALSIDADGSLVAADHLEAPAPSDCSGKL